MKTASAKAKGRRLAQETKEILLHYFPGLHPDDITVTASGTPGPDLIFSPMAKAILSINDVECKNRERHGIREYVEQIKARVRDLDKWMLVLGWNKLDRPLAVMPLDQLCAMIRDASK